MLKNTTNEKIEVSEIQKQELEYRLWLDSTLTQFDDLLRLNFNRDLEDFSDVVIFHIAKLLNAVKASFFTVDNDRQIIMVSGTYGVLLKNMPHQTFEVGEGPVGQVVKSKEMLYFEDLPMYNSVVTTSLACLNSTFLIITPLIFNDVVYGVIETAHLKRPEQKYLDLLERLSKNIASMLQSIQANQKTKSLLQEAQLQAEMLRSQEEEMRQNMEELTATQEEMERKQKELERANKKMKQNEAVLKKAFARMREQEITMREALDKAKEMEVETQSTMEEMRTVQAVMKQNEYELAVQVKAINNNLATLALNLDKQIVDANPIFLKLSGYELKDIKNKPYEYLLNDTTTNSKEYQRLWKHLMLEATSERGQFKFKCNQGKHFWIKGSFTPVKSPTGEVIRLMLYGVNVTGQKLQDKLAQKTIQNLETSHHSEIQSHKKKVQKYEQIIQKLQQQLKNKSENSNDE